MVDYLCREKLVVPSFSAELKRGRARRYSFGDVVVLRGVAKLLQNGISVSRLKAGLKALRGRHREFTPESVPASLLVSDGIEAYFRESEQVLEELKSGQLVFVFVLELDGIRKEIVGMLNPKVSRTRVKRRNPQSTEPRTHPAVRQRRAR